ncbi:MAG: YifB family Mg chelatase-like AAA ATPase [Lachnospiraceae bacterium]|nr:YifB family Mg chelatase-like AAA ATPase [Lachnospiraceae bacterium]
MYSAILSGGLQGVFAYIVHVEIDVASGLPGFSMVGYLAGEVKEARERVLVALKNTGFDPPAMKITVNLSPADVRKEGTAYDLPIAIGMLQSMGLVEEAATKDVLFLGELGLNGEVKSVRGVLPIVRQAAKAGFRCCVVPIDNVMEGAVIPGIEVRGAQDIVQVMQYLQTNESVEDPMPVKRVDTAALFAEENLPLYLDFADVSGQRAAKRAAEIAAAGFHNLLMSGAPGSGKSMIAKRIAGILPPISMEESLEVSSIYSVAGLLGESHSLIVRRPFQAPHHNISQAALTGGSSIPRPGLISLSHRGVLFLDELPEYGRSILDSLRQPLEEHEVQVARVHGNVRYPAHFMLVCAMNPCPCGYYPDRNRCTCKQTDVERYQGRVSGPILDRIDLCVEVLPMKWKHLKKERHIETSKMIRERVMQAIEIQSCRFQGSKYQFNSEIEAADIERYCRLGTNEQRQMEQIFENMGLSARGYHRILKVARTIADLDGADEIQEKHLTEAVYYRLPEHR